MSNTISDSKFPSERYESIGPPGEDSPLPQDWAKDILENVLRVGRSKIVLFDKFPPQNVDYYKALQEEIAKKIPEEQNRPFICLNIKGRNRLNEQSAVDVGMAGGTGPLSDDVVKQIKTHQLSSLF